MRCFLLSLQVNMKYFKWNCNSKTLSSRYPDKFLKEIAMDASQFSNDIIALCITLVLLRVVCYFILKWRIVLNRWKESSYRTNSASTKKWNIFIYRNIFKVNKFETFIKTKLPENVWKKLSISSFPVKAFPERKWAFNESSASSSSLEQSSSHSDEITEVSA